MENVKIILDDLNEKNVSELFRDYNKDKITIEFDLNNNFKIISNFETWQDIYYGRKINNKYYIARYEEIYKADLSDIDYYAEFFSNGIELS